MNRQLEIFQNKVVCQRCNGNGLIYKASLLPMNQVAYICDECDATWLDYQNISIKNFLNFTTYVNSRGYTYDQIQVVNEDYYWYRPNEAD